MKTIIANAHEIGEEYNGITRIVVLVDGHDLEDIEYIREALEDLPARLARLHLTIASCPTISRSRKSRSGQLVVGRR